MSPLSGIPVYIAASSTNTWDGADYISLCTEIDLPTVLIATV